MHTKILTMCLPKSDSVTAHMLALQVEVLAKRVLQLPVEIQVGGRSVVNKDIEQIVEMRPEGERFLRLLEILGQWYEKGKILVFVQTQEGCDELFRDLLKVRLACSCFILIVWQYLF